MSITTLDRDLTNYSSHHYGWGPHLRVLVFLLVYGEAHPHVAHLLHLVFINSNVDVHFYTVNIIFTIFRDGVYSFNIVILEIVNEDYCSTSIPIAGEGNLVCNHLLIRGCAHIASADVTSQGLPGC